MSLSWVSDIELSLQNRYILKNCLLTYFTDSELVDAKDKLSKADSSSSDTDEDTPHKRKKPITHADKPSEEVSFGSSR